MWSKRESNPHASRHTALNRTCLPFHHLTFYRSVSKRFCLGVTIGAKKSKVLSSIIQSVPVLVVNLKKQILTAPSRLASAKAAFVRNSGLDHRSPKTYRALSVSESLVS